jgi:2-hydroxy-6-oxonona-2,4-dienedioate hydrolase
MNKKKIWSAVSVFGIGLGALTYFRYRRDMRAAFKQIKAGGSRVIDTACGPVEFAIFGEGVPVLVVHGAGGGFDQGLWIAKRMGAEGFQFIAPSRFGYLSTPLQNDTSAAAQADMHACLLDALNIRQVAVLGASAGAPSSLQFVLRHPQRASALVLLVPAAYAPPDRTNSKLQPTTSAFMANVVLKSDFIVWLASKTNRSSLLHLLGVPPAVQRQLTLPEQKQLIETILFPISRRQKGLINDGIVVPREIETRYPLEQITIPTLIISSADDPYNTLPASKYIAERIPGARFIGLEQGGHLFIGQEKKVQSEVTAFLEQNLGSHIMKKEKYS